MIRVLRGAPIGVAKAKRMVRMDKYSNQIQLRTIPTIATWRNRWRVWDIRRAFRFS